MPRFEGGEILRMFVALPVEPFGQQIVPGDLLSQSIGSILATAAFQILEDEKIKFLTERLVFHRFRTRARHDPV